MFAKCQKRTRSLDLREAIAQPLLAAIGKTPDAAASHSVSAKKSAGEKAPVGPRKRQIACKNGRSNLPQADLTAGNVGRISGSWLSEKSRYGWLAGRAGFEQSQLGHAIPVDFQEGYGLDSKVDHKGNTIISRVVTAFLPPRDFWPESGRSTYPSSNRPVSGVT